MYHLTISPDTYEILKTTRGQNPLIQGTVNHTNAARQHAALRAALPNAFHAKIQTETPLPDLVYIASGGLSLPNLPEPVVILPHMKYASRKAELPYVQEILLKLGIRMVEFPSSCPFEGESECIWLNNGQTLLHAYGFRSTKKTGTVLQTLLNRIYTEYKKPVPNVVSIQLQSPRMYHLDMAALAYSPTGCLAHIDAFDSKGFKVLESLFTTVTKVNTQDPFALNSVVLEKTILTHKPLDPKIKHLLETLSKKPVTEVNVSEFEKGGGAVRCLVMEICDPTLTQSSSP